MQDENKSTVGAAGVPPVPNSNKNPKPDVVAGLDPPTEACIIRPDMGLLKYIARDDVPLLRPDEKLNLQHTIAYIQHLEHQLTVAQNQNNLSLTTLRAERDEYKADAERFRLIDKMFSPAFENKSGTLKIYALNIHTRQEYGFNWIDQTSIRAALDGWEL